MWFMWVLNLAWEKKMWLNRIFVATILLPWIVLGEEESNGKEKLIFIENNNFYLLRGPNAPSLSSLTPPPLLPKAKIKVGHFFVEKIIRTRMLWNVQFWYKNVCKRSNRFFIFFKGIMHIILTINKKNVFITGEGRPGGHFYMLSFKI